MVKTVVRLSIIITAVLVIIDAKGQDPHFAGTQDMNIWYNPALKINKVPDAHISIRNVTYPNIIAYSSKAATIELPLISREKEEEENIFFMNLAAGIIADNTGNKFMNASTAMLSLSYALPLNYNSTYLAIGFQGCYTFNRVGFGSGQQYPAKFDRYGAIAAAMASDPFESGLSYGYLTLGAGGALFHSGQNEQWYIGVSVRHFNHPYTEWTSFARMPSNYGIQSAYTIKISSLYAVGCYGNFIWRNGIHEQIIGGHLT
ncbi:MAG: hypothetical protein ABIN89_31815, partial [Chitinophagaceae bacterium]